jgi:hypothetical protein
MGSEGYGVASDLLTKSSLIAGLGMLEPRALCNWIKFLQRLLRLFSTNFRW